MMIEAVSIGGYARHENITAESAAAERLHARFNVARSGPAFPIVDIIENDIEGLSGERGFHGLAVVAICHDILHATTQIVPGTTV